MRLQGAADARRRARRRTLVLQVPDNKADAVPCERLHVFRHQRKQSLNIIASIGMKFTRDGGPVDQP